MPDNKIPIGVQLYSIREDCAKDLPGSLAAVAKMGYKGVEYAGYHNRTAKELRKMQDDLGIKCCGTHIGLDTLQGDNLQKTMDFNRELGNIYLVVPGLPKDMYEKSKWLDTAKIFNEISDKVKAQGFKFGYHNHSHEFAGAEPDTFWEALWKNTKPEVFLQFDVGNAMRGGANPISYIRRHKGRSVTFHLKPFSKSNPAAAVGEDEVNWPELFEACEKGGGVQWYIVEHESDPVSPMNAVRKCIEGLKKLGKI